MAFGPKSPDLTLPGRPTPVTRVSPRPVTRRRQALLRASLRRVALGQRRLP